MDTIHDTGSEAPSAAIQHRLQEQKEGQPTFHPKKQTKKRKQKPLKTPSKTIIEFARASVWIYRIVKGKVVEGWNVDDELDFLKQLGVIEYKGFPDEDVS